MPTEALYGATGDPPPSWAPLWSPGSSIDLPPNHDMSPAPTERLPFNPWADYQVEVDLENCPHCGKPLSE